MLEHRIYTFLKLCDVMNYRITAEELNMTQPAVTQHIKFLEQEYGCKLFTYDKKKLIKTSAADILESYARTAKYNDMSVRQKLSAPQLVSIRMGATKTLGGFSLREKITDFLKNSKNEFSLTIDNTENLLKQIDDNNLDFALIEGFFDKRKYGYKLFRKEEFLGICDKGHQFADNEIELEDIFDQTLIVREQGSGTRAIFEQILHENNYSTESFARCVCISSFDLIKKLVSSLNGISFVYKTVADSDDSLGTFRISENRVTREFNYVFLKDTCAEHLISTFENVKLFY